MNGRMDRGTRRANPCGRGVSAPRPTPPRPCASATGLSTRPSTLDTRPPRRAVIQAKPPRPHAIVHLIVHATDPASPSLHRLRRQPRTCPPKPRAKADGRARLPPSRAPTWQTRGRHSRHRPPHAIVHLIVHATDPALPSLHTFLSFPSSCLGTHPLRSSGFAPLPKRSFGDPRFSLRRLHRRARWPGVPALGWSRGTGPPDTRSELLVPSRAPSRPPAPASQAETG